jgi:oxygen-independent coproporphyrinogen-3 oxidase
MLAAAGIAQYEISNFARTAPQLQSNESRHNLRYWTRQPYLGFGVDAHSMLEPVEGRASSPVRVATAALGCPAERSSAAASGHSNSRFPIAVDGIEANRHQAVRFATPDSLDAYMNRVSHTVTPVSAQAAIEESFFLGLRLNRGSDLERLSTEFGPEAIALWESAIQQCLREGLLEQQATTLRLTARGRLLSNEVFARFLIEETKVGTGHVNPR